MFSQLLQPLSLTFVFTLCLQSQALYGPSASIALKTPLVSLVATDYNQHYGAWDNKLTPGNLSTANSDFLSVNQGNGAGTSVGTPTWGLPSNTGSITGPFTTIPTRKSLGNIPVVAFDYRTYGYPQRLGTPATNALFNGIYAASNWCVHVRHPALHLLVVDTFYLFIYL